MYNSAYAHAVRGFGDDAASPTLAPTEVASPQAQQAQKAFNKLILVWGLGVTLTLGYLVIKKK
jgi:hypothetical protein